MKPMANLPNYDYDAEQADIDRQQRMVDALMGGALAPLKMPDVPGAKLNPLSPVIQALTVAMLKSRDRGLQDQQAQLTNRYKADLQAGTRNFFEGISTQAGQTNPGTAVEGTNDPRQGPYAQRGNNPSAYVPPSITSPQDAQAAKMKAVIDAIASNHPQLRQLGMMQMEQMAKANGLTAKDFLGHAAPETVEDMARGAGMPNFRAKREFGFAPNGELPYDKSTGRVEGQGGGAGAPAGQATVPQGWKLEGQQGGVALARDPTGDLYQQTVTGWKKLDNAPRTQVNVATHLPPAETEFEKTVGGGSGKAVVALRERAQAAQELLPQLTKLEELNNSGVYNGPQANVTVFAGQLANSLHLPVDAKKLANSEEYAQNVLKQVADRITAGSGVGRAFSDADREAYLRSFPTLVNSPEGRARIIADMKQSANNTIEQHRAVTAKIKKDYPRLQVVDDMNPSVGAPAPSTSTPTPGNPNVMPWNEYLKKHGLKK